ncbi:molybdopterin-dependent oxidoreductase [Sphingomonas adhaesiva]|uniref:molybdopterin-dependent oxidoreductase n=1 Tax=Sphingomonas adhaesiva TaxID=28212 RepID=UPI002FFBCB36
MPDRALPGRRRALGLIGLGGAGLAAGAGAPVFGQTVDLGFAGGTRQLSGDWPQKGAMIVLRERAPLLETPMSAMDGEVFTPNDRFFVRWHYDDIPLSVDPAAFRLRVGGAVRRPLALSLDALRRLPRVEIAAVNQCSGNSRGLFTPRVPGAQWGDGAIGNALWTGVRLRDVLDLAGIAPGAVEVRVAGLDRPPPGAPWFEKSLAIDHARDGEVMIAWAMNGAALPLLNGFPLRLVVPGWYSTYWIKALDRIEVLTAPDAGYWMAKAYRIPATPGADVARGSKDFATVPIGRMVPRAFFTGPAGDTKVVAGDPFYVRGLAMGGAHGVARVDLSMDAGASWHAATLGPDRGRYGFRLWEATLPALRPGGYRLWARAVNTAGEVQGMKPIWNPGGYMRNPAPSIAVRAA